MMSLSRSLLLCGLSLTLAACGDRSSRSAHAVTTTTIEINGELHDHFRYESQADGSKIMTWHGVEFTFAPEVAVGLDVAGITAESGKVNSMSVTVSSTAEKSEVAAAIQLDGEPFTQKDGELHIGERSFGEVAAGDVVNIDGDAVVINGVRAAR